MKSGRARRERQRWILAGTIAALCLVVAGAGAGAALEDRTVGSFGAGLMWAVTLMTTAGFVHGPPESTGGDVVAVVLMVAGFLLLSLASAVLAAVFVHDDLQERDDAGSAEHAVDDDRSAEILRRLLDLDRRLSAIEAAVADRPAEGR